MSENLNRDFSKYEAMETEELEEILRLDAEAPEGVESDTELILYILEVLSGRRNTNNITGNTAQKAWESFQQNYLPEEPEKLAKSKKPGTWVRKLVAAAAVVALLICIPVSAKALTMEEVWEIIARWAKETFSFVSGENAEVDEPSPDDRDDFDTLQDLLQLSNRDPSIIPTWVPDGFVLEKLESNSSPMQEIYTAFYLAGNKELQIQVRTHNSMIVQNGEIENSPMEIYSHEGTDYYIFENEDQLRVIWVIDFYECLISGDVSINEIKMMIDSIQKG